MDSGEVSSISARHPLTLETSKRSSSFHGLDMSDVDITRLSHEEVREGDIIGIEFAQNQYLIGKDPYIESLGEFKVVLVKQCLCVKTQRNNWFHEVYGYKPINGFGPDMFILLRRN